VRHGFLAVSLNKSIQVSTSVLSENSKNEASFWDLLKKIHHDEEGAVSIETVLIIAAIALPILIFIIKFGWPRIKAFFESGLEDLEGGARDAATGGY